MWVRGNELTVASSSYAGLPQALTRRQVYHFFIPWLFRDFSRQWRHSVRLCQFYSEWTRFDNYVVKTGIQFTLVSKFLEHDRMWRLQIFLVIWWGSFSNHHDTEVKSSPSIKMNLCYYRVYVASLNSVKCSRVFAEVELWMTLSKFKKDRVRTVLNSW